MERKHIEDAVRHIEEDMVNDGLLERVGPDQIRLTPKGIAYFKQKEDAINQAVESAKTTKERFMKTQGRVDHKHTSPCPCGQ